MAPPTSSHSGVANRRRSREQLKSAAAKPEKDKWNDTNAFGRLLVYSLVRE
jgi:hypothetical protein